MRSACETDLAVLRSKWRVMMGGDCELKCVKELI